MKRNRLFSLLTAGMLSLAALTGCGGAGTGNSGSSADSTGSVASGDLPHISLIQYVEHPSLDTIRESILAQLEELGYKDGETCTIDYKNAQGETTTANTIVQKFAGDEADVVVAIATPVAQTAATIAKDIPVVFSAVTDPISAGLTSSLEKPDQNITGTSDAVMVNDILDLAKEFCPDMKTLGFLYCTGEANSESNLEKVKAYCEENNLKLEVSGITNSSEVQQAAQVLFSKVDAVFIPNDNTVASAMPAVSNEAIKAKVPVFTGADSMVGDGGLATNGIEYVDLGKETANIVDQVLKGTDVSEIPVKVFQDDLSIFVNEETAKALGIEIPESVSSDPNYKVKNSND